LEETMSGVTTEYLDLSDTHNNDEELIMQAYREFGFGWSFARSLKYPGMFDPRPAHCPDAIDAFLWGGLSTSVTEAFVPAAWKRLQLSFAVRLVVFIIVFGPLFMSASPPFQWMFPVTEDGTTTTYVYYILYSVIVFVLSQVLLSCLVVPIMKRADEDLRLAIHEVAPHFHRVGYDLAYETRHARCGAYDAFVRIKSASPEHVAQINSTDNAVVDEPSSVGPEFRVLVYGGVFLGSYWVRAMGFNNCSKGTYFFIDGRPSELKPCIDKFTWGAVATAMRPLTLDYSSKLRSMQFIVFLFFFVWLQLWDDVGVDICGSILTFVLLLVAPALVATFVLTPYGYQKAHDAELRQQLEQKIQSMSPLVEERSGYSISAVAERTTWCSGQFQFFVYFQPRRGRGTNTAYLV
jgi:hypothetical protein